MAPSRYASTWVDTKGPGDARPTALQIIADEGLEGAWEDKTVLITGTASGLGIETARAMAATGARVFCTARNLPKAEEALKDILKPGKVELVEMEQSSLAAVRKGAEEFLSRSGNKLNILICNAAIMQVPTLEKTTDGFESQFATNHLSHFLLFNLVKDAMIASSTPLFNSRVVTVSSTGHRGGPPLLGNYNFSDPNGPQYSGGLSYAQAKSANIWMTNYIERAYGSKGLHGLCVAPGGILTGLQVHIKEMVDEAMKVPAVQNYMKNPAQGAATQVWAAVSKEYEGKGRVYLEDCDETPLVGADVGAIGRGYLAHAFDTKGEDRLWADSLKMVGLSS